MPKPTYKPIALRVYASTIEERDQFQAQAKAKGLSFSAYVRMLVIADGKKGE